MREWLRDRRNALVDAVLAYLLLEWVGPALVSAVLTMASTADGRIALAMIAYPFVLAGEIYLLYVLKVPIPAGYGGGPYRFGPRFGRF
jgi:hypothetical protein